MSYAVRVLAVALTVSAIGVPAQVPARASSGHSGITYLCRFLGRITVEGLHQTTFFVRNDNFAHKVECLANRNHWPNFTVVSSGADSSGPEAMAFPEIALGCAWGACTPHSSLPRRITRLGNPVTWWSTTQVRGGLWNCAYDIWFARHDFTNGHDRGAELMIWLNTTLGRPSWARLVRIGNRRYWFLTWRACRKRGVCWTYMSFRRVRPTTAMRGLRLMPFFRFAERARLLDPGWWLTSIDAGFEIWRGGRGLATDSYWTRL